MNWFRKKPPPKPPYNKFVTTTGGKEDGVVIRQDDHRVFVLNAAETDKFLCEVALARSVVRPKVPASIDRLQEVRWPPVETPIVHVFQTDDAVVIALRHPGLGWIGYHMKPHAARDLSHALRFVADDVLNPRPIPE